MPAWLVAIPGLTARSGDAVSGLSYPLMFPLFISSSFGPTSGLPGPMRWFAQHQPLASIVNSDRSIYAEHPVSNDGWITIVWSAGLLLVTYALAMRTYRCTVA